MQSATYLLVRQTNRQHALAQIDSNLRNGARIFEKLIEQRNQQITGAAAILSRDHAFQAAFADSDQDRETTLSALESLQSRIKADIILIASTSKQLLFDLHEPEKTGVPFPFPKLIDDAEKSEAANAFVIVDGWLCAMAATPLLAPDPIAWLCPGFRIDDEFAREIASYAHAEITFFNQTEFFASTFDRQRRESLVASVRAQKLAPKHIAEVQIDGEPFLTYAVPLPVEGGTAVALLQRSLEKELAPYKRLERTYLLLALLGLAISVALGIWIARGVSKPVLELAAGARQIAVGDYQHRVDVRQQDELGSLADSFNHMSQGLAERDRVRDLLGKVVSAEVATELLRKEVVLGGEEREVTILFSDLRNFTAMSERLGPHEILALLNRYFTRMSGIIEKHGGVIDKYVGDALMALFGAPLTTPRDADHALLAAIEMSDALDELNREWAERGLRPIDLGIGINTDVVVAGNMGSATRLNYTVIGDGVNLASRLEGLTKTPEYATRIIVSASTLAKATGSYRTRRLGEVAVKGKSNTTEIFALLGSA
ncbi:MAG TPA: adenylate/guanylate cyclase domain-containing protein [Chthoniobacterales bacterium]